MALSIGTFNMHGSAKERLSYLNTIMKSHDIVLVQEHWLHNEQLGRLHSEIDNVCTHGVSDMDSTTLIHGHPYGGCAIL